MRVLATTAKTRIEKAVKYAVDHAGGGGGGVIESNCTVAVDSDTGKSTITTDTTAVELFNACTAGKTVLAEITVPASEEPAIVRKTIPIHGQVIGDDEEQVYEFHFIEVDSTDGAIAFFAGNLSADDTVVFRQV